eukprot:scaffold124334_cov31-Attheya_sp.AAC.1
MKRPSFEPPEPAAPNEPIDFKFYEIDSAKNCHLAENTEHNATESRKRERTRIATKRPSFEPPEEAASNETIDFQTTRLKTVASSRSNAMRQRNPREGERTKRERKSRRRSQWREWSLYMHRRQVKFNCLCFALAI